MKLLDKYIPAASTVLDVKNDKDPECRIFRRMMEQGYEQGIPKNSGYQGYYVLTPSGKLLGFQHSSKFKSGEGNDVVLLLKQSLEKWTAMTRRDRLLPQDPTRQLSALERAERYYPEQGLVLHQYSRDLPYEVPVEYDRERQWRQVPASQWSQDFAWFTKGEARQFLPSRLIKGQKYDIPEALILRLVCCHLVEYRVSEAFDREHAKRARLTAEVTGFDSKNIVLRFEGETRADANGQRGIETRLLGKATYERAKERFTRFEVVALGTRWGSKEYYSVTEGDPLTVDPGPAPTGFFFTLAGSGAHERLAPYRFHKYGWTK